MAKSTICFVAKAYNNLDINASLIDALLDDPDFNVVIMGVHQKHDLVHYNIHSYDLAAYFIKKGALILTPDDFSEDKSIFSKWRRRIISSFNIKKEIPGSDIQAFSKKLLKKTALELLPAIDMEQCGQRFFEKIQPDYLIVDESTVYSGPLPFAKILCDIAKEKNVPIQGNYVGQNLMLDYKGFKTNRKHHNGYENFLLTPSELDRQYSIQAGALPELAKVAGSLRFHESWTTKLDRLLKQYKGQHYQKLHDMGQGKTKVVLMLSKMQYGISESELFETIQTLLDMDDVFTIIKPHTRNMEALFLSKLDMDPERVYVDFETPSTFLVEWCDACFVYISSIGIQAMVMDKLLGCIDYGSEYRTEYTEFNACWTIRDLTDLKENLVSYATAKSNRPYKQKDVNRFMREKVYAGQAPHDIALKVKNMIAEQLSITQKVDNDNGIRSGQNKAANSKG